MLCSYTEALKDVHNGLNHVMRGRSISVLCYPGLDEIIEESNPHIIEVGNGTVYYCKAGYFYG